MKDKIYINGDFVNADKARIDVYDFGLNFGYGVFETMQAYNGEIFLLAEHLERLSTGAKALSIRSPHLKKFRKENKCTPIDELLKLNRLTECDAYIKIIVTKGTEGKNATIIIFAKAIEDKKNAQLRDRGVKAILIAEPNRYKPNIKNLNYLPNILARIEAKKNQAYDAIFETEKGLVLEGSASNIFIVKDKRLITPEAKGLILPGVTREKVIELAKRDGLRVTSTKVKTDELLNSDEAFLTNSIIEIVPLVKINSRTISSGKAGEITKRIQKLYCAAITG